MKKLLLAALSLVSFLGFAQKEIKSPFKKTEAKSLLWKISGNGLKDPSYLYGTIHITCDATLDKATQDALANTKQLYLEMDMDDPGLQAAMMSGMVMKDGKTMSSLLPEADFKILDSYMKEKTGVSATMMNTMKPFVLSMMFLPGMLDCPMQSVEEELMKVSKAQQEEVFGLETAADQFAVFDAIPYEVQLQELMKSVKDKFTSDKAEMTKMYDVYKTKDINAMLAMTQESENAVTADYQDVLLNDRNANWIPKIETIAKEKPTFFGVGAAHLAGEKGVIALLRKKGFSVEAVK